MAKSSPVISAPRFSADGGYGRGIRVIICGTGPKATVVFFRFFRRVAHTMRMDYSPIESAIGSVSSSYFDRGPMNLVREFLVNK